MNKRASAAVVGQRIEKIIELLCMGLQRSEILQFVVNKSGWPVSERTGDYYIGRANAMLAESATIDRARELTKARRRLETLFARSFANKDYKTCRAIQKDISDLFGLNAPIRTELTGPDGTPIAATVTHGIDLSGLSDDDLRILESLACRVTQSDRHSE